LWAVADPAVAAVIERAHQDAVKDALTFIEDHALFTRTGPQGIRQVNVRGLVATAFTHRDSRAGDPISIPTSRSRTRCTPSTGVGCRSMGGCCSKPTWQPRRPTTLRSSSTSATALVCGLRNGPAPTRRSGRSGRSSVSTSDSTDAGPPAVTTSTPAAASSPSSSSMIMAGHRPRSKLYIWHNRRPWRPATPNTNPGPWLSNARPAW
jgi:TrwC relaxase